jgi:hypothetical protein
MVPQLARIARPFGIEVCSSGGFDSLTDKHRIGQLWADSAVTVLHIGDHDPSSVHVFSSLAEDIEEFAAAYGGDVEFVRVAVTPEQAALYNLPSAPPKPTDNRPLRRQRNVAGRGAGPTHARRNPDRRHRKAVRPSALRGGARSRLRNV